MQFHAGHAAALLSQERVIESIFFLTDTSSKVKKNQEASGTRNHDTSKNKDSLM